MAGGLINFHRWSLVRLRANRRSLVKFKRDALLAHILNLLITLRSIKSGPQCYDFAPFTIVWTPLKRA